MDNKVILASAIAGLVAFASSAHVAQAQDKPVKKERCYGVAKKGMNDCGTATHSCAGKAAADNLPEEWKYVAAGTCTKMGGQLKVADASKSTTKTSDAPKK